jgi:hypothetical protein
MILKCSPFAQVIYAPICGYVIHSFGPIHTYKIGFFTFVLVTSAFAFLQLISSSGWFFAFGLLCRLLSSFASSLMATSGIVILLNSGKTALHFVSGQRLALDPSAANHFSLIVVG